MRLGLVGAGRWGKRCIATIGDIPGIELVSLASGNPRSAELVPDFCRLTSEWRKLVCDPDLDGVILTTPPHTHLAMAVAAIEVGTPVFVEKPMTLSVVDAEELANRASGSGVLVMVDHTHLFSPAYRKLKACGTGLGRPLRIESSGGNWGPFRADTPVLWDYGAHDVAMCLNLTGDYPRVVDAHREATLSSTDGTGESLRMYLEFDSGTKARIRVSNVDDKKTRWFKVNYERGTLIYDDLADSKLSFEPAVAPGEAPTCVRIEVEPHLPLTIAITEFCECVAAGKKFHSSVELGRQTVEVLARCEAELDTRRHHDLSST